MLSVNILYITCRVFFFDVRHNNQDGRCSFTSSDAEGKLYHRKGINPIESIKTD